MSAITPPPTGRAGPSHDWAALGLTDVRSDPRPSVNDLAEVRVSGTALYDPTVKQLDGFPGQNEGELNGSPRRVRYRLAPMGNPSSMNQSLRLRRIYSTVVSPPPSAASETSTVHDPTGRIASQMASIAVTPRLLGTWNTSDGLWAVFDDDARKQEVELTQWSQHSLPHRQPDGPSTNRASADTWTDVLEVLIQIVAILAGLHARSLALVACRPEYFVVARLEGSKQIEVRLSHLVHIVKLASDQPNGRVPSRSGNVDDLELSMRSTTISTGDNDVGGNLAEAQISDTYGEATLRQHLRFLAPESISKQTGSATADVYSFGVCAYELLTGHQTEPPTASPTSAYLIALVDQHIHATVPSALESAPDLPPQLASIISLALSPDPQGRYHSTAPLLHDLTRLQSNLSSSSPSTSKFTVGETNRPDRSVLPPGSDGSIERYDRQTKISTSSTFLSQMSHEMRTPLYAVLGLVSVLEDSHNLNSMQREHLATIRTSGEDLQHIISNLLDWSKLESGSLQAESIPFSLRDVIESSVDGVATRCQNQGVEIVLVNPIDTDPDTTLVGDPFRIKQVVLNLLSNASKFTSKGTVAVKWAIEPKAGSPDQSTVTLSVIDSGPGIEPDKMHRLFKSFSQVDSSITRQHGGSGLGLAISQSLANIMGGQCSARSVVGEGSTFDFTFVVKNGEKTPDSDKLMPFKEARSAFLLSKPSDTREVMAANLLAFNIQPIHKAPSFEEALSPDDPDGLRNRQYHFVFVHPALISSQELQTLRSLQPAAKFRFVTPVVDIASAVAKLKVPHSALISRPTQASRLYESVRPIAGTQVDPGGRAPIMSRPTKSVTGLDKNIARNYPMNILLVDDSKVNIMVGLRVLERFGYSSDSITTAEDGQNALDLAEQTHFDLIFMDLSMPIMDGYTSNSRIIASPLTGSPVIIALTANADRDTADLCAQQGFFAHLVKPLNIPALGQALKAAYTESTRRKRAEEATSPAKQKAINIKTSLEVYLMGC